MKINDFYWKWKRALRRNRDVINRCISISLTVLLIAFFAYIGITIYKADAERKELANRPPNEDKIVIESGWDYGDPGFNKVAENDRLILEADFTTAEIRVTDKVSGKLWYSNPPDRKTDSYVPIKAKINSQFHIQVLEPEKYGAMEMNNYADSIRKGGLSYDLVEDGIKFTFKFPKANLIIPLQYTLGEDSLQVEIVTKEIVSVGDSAFLLHTVDLLPYFGAGGLNDDGYIFIPDGSGAIIEYNNLKEKYQKYNGLVYGTNPTVVKTKETAISERVSLPVFGSKCNDSAFLAVILSGDASSQITASTSRQSSSYNTVFATAAFMEYNRNFRMGHHHAQDAIVYESSDNMQGKNYAVRYYFMNGEDANYTGMAERYRQHLAEADQLKSTKMAEEKYLVLDLVGAVSIEKYVFGIKKPVITPLTTYNDVCTIVKELKDSGVDNIIVNYIGALESGLNNVMFTGVEPETKLGTKKEFQHMIDYLASEGVQLFIETNPVDLYKNGNGYRTTVVGAKTFFDAYAFQYKYALDHLGIIPESRWHMLMPQLVPEFVENYLGTMSKWNIENISLDRLGSLLYSHYPNDGSEHVSRGKALGLWQEAMKKASDHAEYVMIHGGNAYAAGYADVITDVSDCDSYYDMVDYHIPFYQMVFQEDKILASYGVNTTVDYDLAALKLLETGMNLKFNLIYGDVSQLVGTEYNTIVSYSYEFWKDIIVEKYKMMQEVMDEFKGQKITWHESLAQDVSLTVYETGKVVVNYSDEPYAYRGIKVQPRSYLVLPGGAK